MKSSFEKTDNKNQVLAIFVNVTLDDKKKLHGHFLTQAHFENVPLYTFLGSAKYILGATFFAFFVFANLTEAAVYAFSDIKFFLATAIRACCFHVNPLEVAVY